MARMLAVAERRIDAAARTDYLTSIGARRQSAAATGVHFWVFEHADESGRFIEFVEGASEHDVRSVAEGDDVMRAALSIWREVQGG